MRIFIFILCALWGISSRTAFTEADAEERMCKAVTEELMCKSKFTYKIAMAMPAPADSTVAKPALTKLTAEELVRKAVALCPFKSRCQDIPLVEEYLTQAQKIDNTLPLIHATWGYVYTHKGLNAEPKKAHEWYTKANASYQRWADLVPDAVMPYYWMADLEVISGNTDKALQYINKAVQILPNDYLSALEKCETLAFAHGRQPIFWQAAIDACSHAITLDKSKTDAYRYRSYAHQQLGNTAAAAEDAKKDSVAIPYEKGMLAQYVDWFKRMVYFALFIVALTAYYCFYLCKTPIIDRASSWLAGLLCCLSTISLIFIEYIILLFFKQETIFSFFIGLFVKCIIFLTFFSFVYSFSNTLVIMGTTMQSLRETLQGILKKESLHFFCKNNIFFISDKKLNIIIEQSKYKNIFYVKFLTKKRLILRPFTRKVEHKGVDLFGHINDQLENTAMRNEMVYIKPSYTTRFIFFAILIRYYVMCALWLALCIICMLFF